MNYEPVRLKHGSLPQHISEPSRPLDLQVIFTDLRKTAAALAAARSMATGLGAQITLIAAQVIPYPLSLAQPDVAVEFTEHSLERLAADNEKVEIYLCRDRNETIRQALPPDSVAIVGARQRRWWPSWWLSADSRLVRWLRRDGRRVVVVGI